MYSNFELYLHKNFIQRRKDMKIPKILFILLSYLPISITSFFVINNIDVFLLRDLFVFLTVILIPGYLMLNILDINRESKAVMLLYSTGLSIVFIYITGLINNIFLPNFGIPNPLGSMPILISFNTWCFILLILALIRQLKKSITISISNIPVYLIYSSLIILPILSSMGAVLINNKESNILTIFTLGFIAFIILLASFLNRRIRDDLYPVLIYCISISVLLMLSLRSWFIAGFDISMEFEVFKITQENAFWSMDNFRNAYNACLSITILPSYLSSFINLQDEYIYKLFIQFIFALTPVGIYILLKKLNISSHLAFLSSLFYISAPWFIDPMVTLIRQEIAFLFFILLLIILFDNKLYAIKRSLLFIFFSIGMVMSHYSTTYITMIFFNLSYALIVFIQAYFRVKEKNNYIKTEYSLKFGYLIFLIIATFSWFSFYTNTSGNLNDFTQSALSNLSNVFDSGSRNAIIDQVLKGGVSKVDLKTYTEYYDVKSGDYLSKKDISLYDRDDTSDFSMIPMSNITLPINNKIIFDLSLNYYKLSLILIEIFIVVGLIYITFKYKFLRFNLQYKSMIYICGVLVMLIILLPYVSVGYNFDRLYMQIMFILAIVEVYGAYVILGKIIGKNTTLKVISIFYVSVFLYTYGFFWQFTGGKTVMWLNNFGYNYNETYTHKTEVYSALWMDPIPNNPLIYSTPTGRNILWAYAKKNNINNDLFPSTLDRNAYVYVVNANLKENIATFYHRGLHLSYRYPFEFINSKKNKVYSNGGSEIYK